MFLYLLIILTLFFLCYGSFLNVVGFRIIRGQSIVFPGSHCPKCSKKIAWQDLVPIFSWLRLKGLCRNCKSPISFLYPFIEFITALLFLLTVLFIEPQYWLAYFIFFSALIVGIRTDIEHMLLSRLTTLYLVIPAYMLAYFDLLEISLESSIIGSAFAYISLWSIAKIFHLVRKKHGLGEGDFELLAAIGAFTGISGAWHSLFIGSLTGSIFGIILILKNKNNFSAKIPFGPWLSFGAILYVFLKDFIVF